MQHIDPQRSDHEPTETLELLSSALKALDEIRGELKSSKDEIEGLLSDLEDCTITATHADDYFEAVQAFEAWQKGKGI